MVFYPQYGGMLDQLNLSVGGRNFGVLISADDEREAKSNPTFKGVPLFPFPNRLDGGTYEFGGQTYSFPINEPSVNNNLHGFVFTQPFELMDTQESDEHVKTTLKYVYNGGLRYFPFPFELVMGYNVQQGQLLEVLSTITNTGAGPMPMGYGWHPYYSLGEKVDDLRLKMPGVKRMIMDSRALPTGEEVEFDTFSTLSQIGETFLDDCFELALPDKKATVTLWSPKQQVGLEIWQCAAGNEFQYLQIFTPPGRDRIAIEPMTCNVNAFRNGQGLQTLQAGERFQSSFGVRLIDSLDEV